MSTPRTPADRARVAFTLLAREVSDAGRAAIELLDNPHATPAERLHAARRPRAKGLHLLDLWVIVERLHHGASWADIGDGLGISAGMARDRYNDTVDAWASPDAAMSSEYLQLLAPDGIDDTVRALDAWFDRHAEPWDASVGLVARALA